MNIEGVFIIVASKPYIFYNRRHKLEQVTGFTTGGLDSHEYLGDGLWRVITTAELDSIDEAKKAMYWMEKYTWFLGSDSSLLVDGKEIYCDGRWYQ